MKFQGFNIQIITLALGVILLAAGLATTSAYGLVKITSPAKGQHVSVGISRSQEHPHLTQLTIVLFQSLLTV